MKQKTVHITDKSGLILEGGGMRGIFTIGVLDNLMDRGIMFPYVIGVSAGACNALSYLSGQRGRAKFINIDLLKEHNYIGVKHLLTKRNIMDFDLLFHKLPEEIYPYDYKAFAENCSRYEAVTTSCLTGKACYLSEKNDPKRIIDIVKASSSLPFVCPISHVDGVPMLDGGIADSIPLERAISQGYYNNVVVLTRNKGYRKPFKGTRVPFMFYRKYPRVKEAIRQRNMVYNREIELVEKLETEGMITVIRPENHIEVGRMERDTEKMLRLYNEGYDLASRIEFNSGNKSICNRAYISSDITL